MLRATTKTFLRTIHRPFLVTYRKSTSLFQRPSCSAFALLQHALAHTPSFGESERGYHDTSTSFAAEESILTSEPLTTSHLEEEEEEDDHFPDDDEEEEEEEIIDEIDDADGEEANLQQVKEDTLREQPKSLQDVETYRQRRQKLHFDYLLQRTPAELMREVQRLATFPSSLYRRSTPAKLPIGENHLQHVTKAISFPTIYHAVKVVHAIGHAVMLQQADGAEPQRHMLMATFRLIDRLVQEEAAYSNVLPPHTHKKVARLIQTSHIMAPRLLSPSFVMNTVVLRWRELSLAARHADRSANDALPPIWSPKELLSQLQSWSSRLAAGSSHHTGGSNDHVQLYDMIIINMILEVILKTQPDPTQAPLVAERLLQFLLASPAEDETTRLRPDSFTYGLILSAWSHSKLPQAGLRMEALVREMKEQHGIAPTAVTYLILLRFYASQGNLERLQAVLQHLKEYMPDGGTNVQVLSEVVFCHCQTGNLPEASETLYQMLRQAQVDPSLDARARDMTIESIFNVLTSYREAILSSRSSREMIRLYTTEAERLVGAVQASDFIFPPGAVSHYWPLQEQLDNTLSFIYASAGRLDAVETMFENAQHPSYLRYLALVEAYGQHRLPGQATKVLYRLLDDSPHIVSFNTHIFSAVMDAWATAAHPRALENALDILALIEVHPRCLELQIRPCSAVFNTLLQILSNLTTATSSTVTIPAVPSFLENPSLSDAIVRVSNAPLKDVPQDLLVRADHPTGIALDTSRFSIAILDEMERRYKKYGVGKPTHITYSIIIKTCFRANQLELADQIMKRMELSDTPPNIRTYNNILSHYSSFQSSAGADQAEKILLYLREHAREKPHLRPDIVSYSILLKAWAGSGDPESLEHMWHVYELVRSEGIEMDVIFGMHLISCLSSSPLASVQPMESGISPSSSSSIWLQRALTVLEEMEVNKNLTKKPDLRAYKFLLDGYIRSRDLVAATSLVLHMVEVCISGKNPHAKPDQQIFLQVTESWIKHGDLVKATLFANKMRELYLLRQIPMGPGLGCFRMLQFSWHQSTHAKKEMFLANAQSHVEDMERSNGTGTRRSEKKCHLDTSHGASLAAPTFLEVANAAAAKQLHHL
jgi:pentatricopeptide repeat protein